MFISGFHHQIMSGSLMRLESQAFDVPVVSEYAEASQILSETVFSIVRYEVSKRMETPRDYPPHDKFYIYKVFLFDAWKQFYIMSESIEFSLSRYPVFRLRHVCFYQQSIYVLYFLLPVRCLAWRTTKQ